MGKPLSLIFDIGTQSTRAMLFDKQGRLVALAKHDEPPYISPDDNRAEKACEEYWDGICKVSLSLKASAGALWDDIVAVSLTSIRNSLVFLDKDCNPTRDAILWLDKREVDCPDKMPLLNRVEFLLVGMTEVAGVARKTSYTNWVRVNQPEVWEKTDKVVMPSAYFNYLLTGNLIDSKASQAAKIPYNYRKREWMTKWAPNYPVFGCDTEKMCTLAEPGDVLGYITAKCAEASGMKAGLPVIAAGADKACETLGSGSLRSDVASVSFGTAASVEITTDKYVEPEAFMPAYTSVAKGKYNPEVQIFRGFWMITWFKEQFALYEKLEAERRGIRPEKVLDELLDKIPIGCNGLFVQPFWGPGLTTPEARGSMIGFTDIHSRGHIYRAIIEGLNYALLDGLESMERRAKTSVKKIAVSGGGAQSDVVCRITADIFGREAYRVQTSETSGLGAAIIAFTGVGEFSDIEEAACAMVRVKDTFKPDMANNAVYRRYYEKVYKKLYGALRPLYFELYDLLKESRK